MKFMNEDSSMENVKILLLKHDDLVCAGHRDCNADATDSCTHG